MILNPLYYDVEIAVGSIDLEGRFSDLVMQDANNASYCVLVHGGSAVTLVGAYTELLLATARKIERLRMDPE